MPEAMKWVQTLLSDQGSITVQPWASRLQIQDRKAHVDLISRFLEEVDQPPELFRVTIELIEASFSPFEDQKAYQPPSGVSRVFSNRYFRLLGSTAIEGELGKSYVVRLGSGYSLEVGTAMSVLEGGYFRHRVRPERASKETGDDQRQYDESQLPSPPRILRDRIVLNPLRLTKLQTQTQNVAQEFEVFKTKINLTVGQQAVLGTGKTEQSPTMFVLVVNSESVEGK
jgi:hypothetical protein